MLIQLLFRNSQRHEATLFDGFILTFFGFLFCNSNDADTNPWVLLFKHGNLLNGDWKVYSIDVAFLVPR